MMLATNFSPARPGSLISTRSSNSSRVAAISREDASSRDSQRREIVEAKAVNVAAPLDNNQAAACGDDGNIQSPYGRTLSPLRHENLRSFFVPLSSL